jgi:hypothetical protein
MLSQDVQGHFVSNELLLCWDVDSHVARVMKRRRSNANVHLNKQLKKWSIFKHKKKVKKQPLWLQNFSTDGQWGP